MQEINRDRLLRLTEVLQIIPISKSSWWKGIQNGKYPQPIKLGPRTTCWRESDVLELLDNKKQRID